MLSRLTRLLTMRRRRWLNLVPLAPAGWRRAKSRKPNPANIALIGANVLFEMLCVLPGVQYG